LSFFVQDGVYDDFRARLLERIAAGQVGDPGDWQTDVGPLVNQRQFDDVLEGIEYDRPDGIHVAEDADGHPMYYHGVYKQANEGAARVYSSTTASPVSDCVLTSSTAPGRDHGMTAEPTLAMVAAVRGERYEIPFGGRAQFQYAPEAARMFVDAARPARDGAEVWSMGGPSGDVADVTAAIEAALPAAAGTITFRDEVLLPLPEHVEARSPARTPLAGGIRKTIEVLQHRQAAGRVAQ
jgi:hypothetical protein